MKNVEKVDTTRAEDTMQESSKGNKGLTLRILIIGLIFVGLLMVMNLGNEWWGLWPGIEASKVPSGPGMALILALTGVNFIAKRFKLKFFEFSRGEMTTLYGMIAIGGLLSGWPMRWLPWTVMQIPRFKYVDINPKMLEFTDRGAGIVYPASRGAAMDFFNGEAPVPWGEWIIPILFWTVLFTISFLTFSCVITLVRLRWTEHERLQYPLTIPVLTLMNNEKTEGGVSHWKNKYLWLGLGLSFVYIAFRHIKAYLPFMPSITGISICLMNYIEGNRALRSALQHHPSVYFTLRNPSDLGIGFLMPLQISFSSWFSYLILYRFALFIGYNMGKSSNIIQSLELTHLSWSRIGLAIVYIWSIKGYVKEAFTFSAAKEDKRIDADEATSYKTAVIGLILGLTILVIYGVYLYAKVWVAIYYWLTILAGALVLARIRAEVGLPVFEGFRNGGIIYGPGLSIPRSWLGNGSIYFDGTLYPAFEYGPMTGTAGTLIEQYRIGDIVGIKKRTSLWALTIALVAGMLFAWIYALKSTYQIGGVRSPQSGHLGFAHNLLGYGFGKNVSIPRVLFGTLGLGVGVTSLLYFLNARFVWWPLHPLGYVMATHGHLSSTWSHYMIAWAIKFAASRYGGASLVKRMTPFFLGLIIGEALGNTFWGLIRFITVVLWRVG